MWCRSVTHVMLVFTPGYKMATNTGPIPKPIKQKTGWHVGKVKRQWLQVRRQWLTQNPPTNGDYYECALCGQPVHKDEVTLDHIVTRSHDPNLRYDFDNLQPAHYLCNTARGSMSMEAWNARRYK